MAIPATVDFEVRSDGAATGGGGFDRTAGGTNYSLQAAAQKTGADLTMHATDNTKVQPVAAGVAAADIGNIVNITAGTDWTPGRYVITAQDGTYWTLHASPSAAANANLATYYMGGALASPETVAGASPIVVGGNIIYVLGGTHTLGATWNILADGDATGGKVWIVGYTSTRTKWNTDTRPIVTSATNSIHLISLNGANYLGIRNIQFTHTAVTRGKGIHLVTGDSSFVHVDRCIFDGVSLAIDGAGSRVINHLTMTSNEAKNCTSTTAVVRNDGSAFLFGNDIHDNLGAAYYTNYSNTLVAIGNLFDTNTYGIRDATTNRTGYYHIIGNSFVDNSSDAIEFAGGASQQIHLTLLNNVFYGSGTWNVDCGSETAAEMAYRTYFVDFNAAAPGASGDYNGLNDGPNDITLTVDPFTNRATRDFSLNNTAGGGAACRAARFPATLAGVTDYGDIGALDHQDAAAGGVPPMVYG